MGGMKVYMRGSLDCRSMYTAIIMIEILHLSPPFLLLYTLES